MMNIYKLNGLNVAKWNSFLLFAIALFIFSVFEPFAYGDILSDEAKKVQISETQRQHIGFDDSSWLVDAEGLCDEGDNVYTRRTFTIKNPTLVTRITLTVVCDVPFFAYLNGIEIAQSDKGTYEPIDLSGFADELLPGNNVFAVEFNEVDVGNTNLLLSPNLEIGVIE